MAGRGPRQQDCLPLLYLSLETLQTPPPTHPRQCFLLESAPLSNHNARSERNPCRREECGVAIQSSLKGKWRFKGKEGSEMCLCHGRRPCTPVRASLSKTVFHDFLKTIQLSYGFQDLISVFC